MKWIRDKFGGLIPRKDDGGIPALEKRRDPLEIQADAAARHFGFDEGEREEYVALQRRLAGDPQLMKQLIRRQRRSMRAARMSPTIKSRPLVRSRRSK